MWKQNSNAFLGLLVMILVVAIGLTGCEGKSVHISGSQFQYEFEMRHQQTMSYAYYLGEKNGKVYLLKKSMSIFDKRKWNEQLLYAEVTELDPKFLLELRELGRPEQPVVKRSNK